MNLVQRLKGDLYLAWRATVAHPLRLLFSTDERSAKDRFLSNYAGEGNLPTTEADRRALLGASRCIHCGLCDTVAQSLSSIPRQVLDGPSLLPVALSRAMPDLPHGRAAVAALDEHDLARGEKVCPTRVPLREIAEYLRRKDRELTEQREEAT